METITMHTSRTYDILMEDGLITAGDCSAAEHISKVLPPVLKSGNRKCCVVCDKTVYRLYGHQTKPFLQSLAAAGYETCAYAFKPGEDSKNIATVSDLCHFLAENHFTREDFIVALGGGVCGDISGFAASIYMRGISFVQVPTTLLAMADSSVGGKTGVNTEDGKNMIGTFWQPALVIIDPKVLDTLSEEQLLNGLAEIIKAGFIADGTIFDSISEGLPVAISKAIQVKKQIVEEDEREGGKRKLLNFGHTIGHAIEKCSGYSVPHGYAVMTGMYLTALAAEQLKWSRKHTSGMIRNVIDAFAYPVYTKYNAHELANVAAGDKKRNGENISIVYPDKPGHCAIRDLPVTELTDFISRGLDKAEAGEE